MLRTESRFAYLVIKRSTGGIMQLKDLIRDKTNSQNSLSLSRTIALATFVVLSVGFVISSYRKITGDFFVYYPAGVMIVFVPQLFLRLVNKLEGVIKAWKGGSE
jgi:hypothetical protein